MQISKITVIFLLLLPTCGPQKGSQEGLGGAGGQGGDAAPVYYQLFFPSRQKWKGEQVYRGNKENGLFLESTPVILTFLSENEFTLHSQNSSISMVKGYYFVSKKKIVFTIDESKLPSFGAKGSFRTMFYELSDNKLHLLNEEVELNLSEEGKTPDPKDQPTVMSQLFRTWGCKNQELTWWITLHSNRNYTVQVQRKHQSTVFTRTGVMDEIKDDQVPITAKLSFKDQDKSNIILQLLLRNPRSLEATVIRDNQVSNSFTCTGS